MKDPNTPHREETIITFAKRELDQSTTRLPFPVQARLRAARRSALSQAPRRLPWMWPATGLAAACAGILAWALFTGTPMEPTPIPNAEDLDLLTTAEPLDFYEDLEFYVWLAETDHAS